jgi:hypothetical protein
MKGIDPIWCDWVKFFFVQYGNLGIKVNDQIGPYFKTKEVLDKVVHYLQSFLMLWWICWQSSWLKEEGHVQGFVPHLVEEGLSILQYEDNIVIFVDHDTEHAKNMKLLLCAFQQLLHLKINFHKSKIFLFGQEKIMRFNTQNYLVIKYVCTLSLFGHPNALYEAE